VSAFDMRQIQCGARLRRTPYFEATQRYGARGYTVYNHMLFPICFADLVEEYEHLLNHVTVWDVSVERQVEITGPDAFAFANLLTPRDLSKCAVGQGKYVIITADDGGIINDPILLRVEENRFWLSLADSDVLLWAKGLAVHSGMDVQIAEPDVWPMQVQGPKSKDVMQTLFGDRVTGLKYYWCAEADLDGIPVVVSRTGWTGEIGFEIYLRDGSRGDELWERVMEAGRPHDIRPIAPCEARRLEAGIFNYQSDIRLENNPFEVMGLERLVDLDKKADYVGKDALLRIHAEGVRRKLVGVDLPGEAMDFELSEAWPVIGEDGEQIGRVTDAIWSPRLERNIGYVWVPIELSKPGTSIRVRTPSGEIEAHTAAIPFLDPTKKVPASYAAT
jgi:aminomethyltransferase